MSDLTTLISQIKNYLQKKKLIENFILLGSILSANFASYISYFDINALSIIDTTTISKYFLGMVVLFVMVSVVISILLFFFQNHINFSFLLIRIIPKTIEKHTISLINNHVFKYFLVIFVFSIFFVGFKNTSNIMIFFAIYFSSIIVYKKLSEKMKTNNRSQENKEIQSTDKLNLLDKFIHQGNQLFDVFSEVSYEIMFNNTTETVKKSFFEYFTSVWGIALVFLSVSLGIARANYVEENIHIHINNESKTYVLFMTSSSGASLFKKENKEVLFIPWGNLSSMVFLSKKRRSLFNK